MTERILKVIIVTIGKKIIKDGCFFPKASLLRFDVWSRP